MGVTLVGIMTNGFTAMMLMIVYGNGKNSRRRKSGA